MNLSAIYVTTGQVAEALGLSVQRINQLCSEGALRYDMAPNGRDKLIARDELERYLQTREPGGRWPKEEIRHPGHSFGEQGGRGGELLWSIATYRTQQRAL
jgi:excisionase family DNA binding protein